MPKRNITMVKLPAEKPDCCAQCPLCGLIPKSMRPHGSKETHVCMGTMDALGGRGIHVKASEKDSHHPLKRWCDARWESAWMKLPGRMLAVNSEVYNTFRIPYEAGLQMVIKFHKN